MEVPADLENRLAELAQRTGRNAESLLHEAIERYADSKERFMAAVDKGISSADKGELVEDEEVLAWLEERERSLHATSLDR